MNAGAVTAKVSDQQDQVQNSAALYAAKKANEVQKQSIEKLLTSASDAQKQVEAGGRLSIYA